MALFDNVLKDSETLFLDEIALDFDYIPKLLRYRESEQQYVATCIKPLFENRNGKNLFITGKPGIGKTAAIKMVLMELEQKTDGIKPIYVNCWKRDTTHKLVLDICEQLDYKWTQNKNTDELLKEITPILNKNPVVFVFDEIDKLTEHNILYNLIEDIYKKSILLVTNEEDFLLDLDQRIKSRLIVEKLKFRSYNYEETYGILKQRMEHAFVKNVFDDDAFKLIADKTFELRDIRTGLFLMRESGLTAENKSSKKITQEHAKKAIEKLKDFQIKNSLELEKNVKKILELVKNYSGKSIKELFEIYKREEGEIAYRTFHRKIAKLEKRSLINIEKEGISHSVSPIVKYKKLTEF